MRDSTAYPWFCPKPRLRILFYTDDPRISLHQDVTSHDHEFGVRILHDLLIQAAAAENLIDVSITLVDRHEPSNGAHRFSADLLADYDEVWFFTARWEPNTADNPSRELDDDEVDALAEWMTDGGVLITGDHANLFRPEDDVIAPSHRGRRPASTRAPRPRCPGCSGSAGR